MPRIGENKLFMTKMINLRLYTGRIFLGGVNFLFPMSAVKISTTVAVKSGYL